MGQSVSNFFTTTVVDVAKNAWGAVVHGVTVLAKWLEQHVNSFVTTLVNSISDMIEGVKNFFINCWHNVEAFVTKIFRLKPNAKDHMWGWVNKMAKKAESMSVEKMRVRLKELGYEGIDSLTDEQVVEKFNKYLADNPMSPEEQKEMEDELGDHSGGPSNMMSYTGGYSKFESPPLAGLAATSPEKFKLRRDHVITHVTLVLLSPAHFSKGPPMSVSLAPHEQEELVQILST